jgi:hypothetical protein
MDLFWLGTLVAFMAASWVLIRIVAGLHEEE